jgi:hypothetical protein
MGALDDLKGTIDEEPVLRRWALATQRRNLASLEAGAGSGGATLAPNAPSTRRRKGHGRVGFHTGQMAAGLVAGGAVNLRVGGPEAIAEVFAGPGSTDLKINAFLKGKPAEERWRSERTPSGKRRAWKYRGPPVPARDFIGIDERDVDRAAEDLLSEVGKQWGFREG